MKSAAVDVFRLVFESILSRRMFEKGQDPASSLGRSKTGRSSLYESLWHSIQPSMAIPLVKLASLKTHPRARSPGY
eukprot:9495171-Pyramimonas_sp.AAC.1